MELAKIRFTSQTPWTNQSVDSDIHRQEKDKQIGDQSTQDNMESGQNLIADTRGRRLSSGFGIENEDDIDSLSASAPQNISIQGRTHEVKIKDGSLYSGEEGQAFENDSAVRIDIAYPLLSRRGPNQENWLNRRQDRKLSPNSGNRWYPIYDEDKTAYFKDGHPYVREDAFSAKNLSEKSLLHKSSNVLRRERAAPAIRYKSVADFDCAGEFVAFQRQYQNSLLKQFNKESILASHRSVGFEYEFTCHDKYDLSHISLAKSDAFSSLFPLRFELETDSGAVIELVAPPFIFPNKRDGEVDSEELKKIHEAMKAEVNFIRDELKNGGSLKTLIQLFEKRGLGKNWVFNEAELKKYGMSGMNVQHPDQRKLFKLEKFYRNGSLTPAPYSQMNIALSGKKIAEFISTRIKGENSVRPPWRSLEKLDVLAKTALPDHLQAMALHINKALVSGLAIPSAALYASQPGLCNQFIGCSRDIGLFSDVKELWCTWVKDALPNILATTADIGEEEKAALKAYMQKAGKLVDAESVSIIQSLQTDIGIRTKGKISAETEAELKASFEEMPTKFRDYLKKLTESMFSEEVVVIEPGKYGSSQDSVIRGDTFIPQIQGSSLSLRHSIAEIRGENAMQKFFKDVESSSSHEVDKKRDPSVGRYDIEREENNERNKRRCAIF